MDVDPGQLMAVFEEDFLQQIVNVNWPGGRILALEVAAQSSQQITGTAIVRPDPVPALIMHNLEGRTSEFNLMSTSGFSGSLKPATPALALPVPNPITPGMKANYYTWSDGATINVQVLLGTFNQGYSVVFLNLDKLKPKGKTTFTFKTRLAGCGETSIDSPITIWSVKWTGKNSAGGTGFGHLPGNGFAANVFATPGDPSVDELLNDPDVKSQSANPDNFGEFSPTSFEVDFQEQLPFNLDHIRSYDLRASTYKKKIDFPVVSGRAVWDVDFDPLLQNTPCEVTLFQDSGGTGDHSDQDVLWEVFFDDSLLVGASIGPA